MRLLYCFLIGISSVHGYGYPNSDLSEEAYPYEKETTTTTVNGPLEWHFSECNPRNATLYFSRDNQTIFKYHNNERPIKYNIYWANATNEDRIVSMAFDNRRQKLIFATHNFPNQIQYIDEDGKVKVLVKNKMGHFEQIVSDTLTGNLYFAEKGVGIGVCNPEVTKCTMLINAKSHDQEFHSLTLHSRRGAMFWIAEGSSKDESELWMSGMDGKKQRVIDDSNLFSAITLDADKEILYLAAKTEILQLDLRYTEPKHYAYKMASNILFFNCELFYVDRYEGHLMVHVKEEEEDQTIASFLPSTLAIAYDNKHPAYKNPCLELKCDDICVLAESPKKQRIRCVLGDNTLPVEQKKSSGISFGWIILFIAIVLILAGICFGLVVYFRLWPALNARIGLRNISKEDSSANFNVVYESKLESVSN